MTEPSGAIRYVNSEGLTRWLGLYCRGELPDGGHEHSARVAGGIIGIAGGLSEQQAPTEVMQRRMKKLFARGAAHGHSVTWRTICLEYEKEQIFRKCGDLIHPQVANTLPALHLRMGTQQRIVSPLDPDHMVVQPIKRKRQLCLRVAFPGRKQVGEIKLPLQAIEE